MKYVELVKEIPSKLEGTIVIGMFQMQRGDLITSLIGAATRLANMLLRRMTEDYQNMIRELVLFFIFAAIRLINLPITVVSYLVKWFSSVQTRLILRQDLFTIFTSFQIQMIKELL